MSKSQTLLDKIWKDKDGQQAIIQAPNIPIIAWFGTMVLSWLVPNGRLKTGLEFVASAFLFTWAWLELYSGRSYFRRALGLIVLVAIMWAHFKN